jgi:hypothetical protein
MKPFTTREVPFMGNVKQESLNWIDQLEALKALYQGGRKPKRPELKDALKLGDSHITTLLAIKDCFDQAALDKVRQAAQSATPYTLSSNGAYALTRLKGRVPDLPKTLHEALDEALSRHMIPVQIEGLVEHMVSGNPAKEFDHTKVKRRSAVRSSRPPYAKATVGTSAGKSKAGNTTTTVENEPETPPLTPEQSPGQKLDEFIDKCRPRFNQILVIGALLLGAWWFRGCWMEKLHLSMPTETSVSTPRRESPGGSRDTKPKTNEAGDAKKNINVVKGETQNPVVSSPNTGMSVITVGAVLSPAQNAEKTFVEKFVNTLFGVTYENVEDRRDACLSVVSQEYQKDFTEAYFSRNHMEDIKYFKEVYLFTYEQPVQLTESDAQSDEFNVKGTLTVRVADDPTKTQTIPIWDLIDVGHDLRGQMVIGDIIPVGTK